MAAVEILTRGPDLSRALVAARMVPVRAGLVDDLENFVRRGALWDPAELGALVAGLEAEGTASGDPILDLMARPFRAVLLRIQIGGLGSRTADDIEAIVYPRLWKVMEAVRDGMPDCEVRIRIEVFNRRLARTFARDDMGLAGP